MRKLQILLLITFIVGIFLSFNIPFKNTSNDTEDFIIIAKILYPDFSDDIENCFYLFVENASKFEEDYSELINDFDLNIEESTLIDLLFTYGDSKNKVAYIDWRGEENEGELEEYISEILTTKINFSETKKLRSESEDVDQRDGEFILQLFNTINKDLIKEGMTLAFFNIEWDAYGFTIISLDNFKEIEAIKKNVLEK